MVSANYKILGISRVKSHYVQIILDTTHKERCSMKSKKIIPVFIILTVLTLTACSSTSGGGSSEPKEVDVVVPPKSDTTVVVPPN